jgi:hypothetical protein
MLVGANGLNGIINRGALRERYGIEGSSLGDFAVACCCTCNRLVQEDNESIIRTTGVNPKTNRPYVSPVQMSHP